MSQQEQIDVICREIRSLRMARDVLLTMRGEAYTWKRMVLAGEIIGLCKALCVLMGWPLKEGAPGGRADHYAREWANVPRETSTED